MRCNLTGKGVGRRGAQCALALGGAALAAMLSGCAVTSAGAPPPVLLHADTYGAQTRYQVRNLVVVLNGDGGPGARSDFNAFATAVATTVPDSVAIALLRPGYSDRIGNQSPGNRGADLGDNYTTDRITAVAGALEALRMRYPRAGVVVVGESGGAAVAANLAAMRPDLVNGIVLVGCPCALPEWRRYMHGRVPGAGWNRPVESLDPLQTVGGIAPSLRAAILVGTEDDVTPVRFSRPYAEALALRGIATDYRILPGRGHAILNDPEVLDATARLAAALLPRRA